MSAASGLQDRPGFVFLESSLPGEGAISLLAADPFLVLEGTPQDWPALEAELARHAGSASSLQEGAAIGWVGFDGRYRFGFYRQVHVFDHQAAAWKNPPSGGEGIIESVSTPIAFTPLVTREEYLHMVERAREYIAAGDIYQVCLAHPFEAETDCSPWAFYRSLRTCSPAPYSAYLDLSGTRVASASPECFLRMDGRTVTTRPIKGTRPRGGDPRSDQSRREDLLSSAKEAAELVMITDLERNDLGRLCEYGSVTVPALLELESYEQVHHLVSTVTGQLRPEVSHAQALLSCLPGGSISGAPKKRALEIIAELEPHPRGLYTRAIGYFGFHGQSQFSIVIRTAIFEGGKAGFHVGAGIVADSVPAKEWQETLDKAAGLLRAAAAMS